MKLIQLDMMVMSAKPSEVSVCTSRAGHSGVPTGVEVVRLYIRVLLYIPVHCLGPCLSLAATSLAFMPQSVAHEGRGPHACNFVITLLVPHIQVYIGCVVFYNIIKVTFYCSRDWCVGLPVR